MSDIDRFRELVIAAPPSVGCNVAPVKADEAARWLALWEAVRHARWDKRSPVAIALAALESDINAKETR